jgi:branched-chain amino acid transport system permease protein
LLKLNAFEKESVDMKTLRFRPCGNFKVQYREELNVFETDFGRLWAAVGIVVLFAVVPWVTTPYLLYVVNLIGISAIAAIGLNILVGSTGLISLGHGAFFGVGAYSAGILAVTYGIPFLAVVPLAGLVTAVVGMIFGIPSGRLKGLYLTIATLAGQFIIEYVLVHWESVTGGTMGLTLPAPSLFGFEIAGDLSFFYVIYATALVMVFGAVNLMRTRYGRAFVAIRDNDRAAEGMGIPIFRYKLLSFAVSSFYAGVAGALWGYYMISITAEPFTLGLSVEYIAMIIIGGLGSIPGAIFGTVFITLLNEGLRWVTDTIMNMGGLAGVELTMAPLREFVFGLAIVLFILFEPRGLAEVWRIIRSNFKLWPFSY